MCLLKWLLMFGDGQSLGRQSSYPRMEAGLTLAFLVAHDEMRHSRPQEGQRGPDCFF